MYNTLLNPLWNITTSPSTLEPLKILDLTKFNNIKFSSIAELNRHTYNPQRYGVQFKDKPDSYIATLNVAGFEKNEIKILEERLSFGVSRIEVTCDNEQIGKLKYEFNIPENSDTSSIKSVLKNGLLTVSIQTKKPKVKTMSIEVE